MLGLDLSLRPAAPPPWWPPQAVFAADFVSGRFRSQGNALSKAEAYAFARPSPKWARRADGNWMQFASGAPAITDLGLSIEPAASNLAVGGALAGAVIGVVGSGGSLPTGWVANGALTTQVLALTTLLGLPAIRLRISGTAVATFYEISLTPTVTALEPASAYSASIFAQCHTEAVPIVELRQGNASDGFVAVNALGPALGASAQRAVLNLVTQATTARGRLRLVLALTSGNSYNLELTLACPQLESGTAPTSPLLVERAADALDLNLPAAGLSLSVQHDSGPPSALSAGTAVYRLPTALTSSTVAAILASPP